MQNIISIHGFFEILHNFYSGDMMDLALDLAQAADNFLPSKHYGKHISEAQKAVYSDDYLVYEQRVPALLFGRIKKHGLGFLFPLELGSQITFSAWTGKLPPSKKPQFTWARIVNADTSEGFETPIISSGMHADKIVFSTKSHKRGDNTLGFYPKLSKRFDYKYFNFPSEEFLAMYLRDYFSEINRFEDIFQGKVAEIAVPYAFIKFFPYDLLPNKPK